MTETVTLTDVRAEQADQLQHDIDAAALKLKDDVAPAEDKADQQVKNDEAVLVQLRAEASVLQQQLAVATMKPERHALELQLYENLKEQRSATAALATHQDQQADCTRQAQTLTSRLTALKTALAQASADLDAARQQDSAAANDRAALTTSAANAQREAGSDAVKAQVAAASDALAKLVGGPNLVDVLRARYEHGQASIGDSQGAAARARQAALAVTRLGAPLAAAVAVAAAAYDDARSAVSHWATTAADGLAGARTALQQTIGTEAFSPQVSADISDRAKAATDSGAAAADKAYHDAATTAIAAQADLDVVTGPKAAVDPGYDPAADDTVKAQRDAADAADQAKAAADAGRKDFADQLIAWDLSLQPDVFQLAMATFGAQSLIAELAALDTAALAARLDAAETAYAGALGDQARVNGMQQKADEEQASREDESARYAAGADQRLLAVVRGDM
jgi:hypothetical protein